MATVNKKRKLEAQVKRLFERPRKCTVSVAIPGSVASQSSRELRAFVCGQVARACSMFSVDEVIVYNDEVGKSGPKSKFDPSSFLARNLQYSETPIYLRRALIPQHADLQFSAMNPPLEAPHHVRANDRTPFREGMIIKKAPGTRPNNGGLGSFVDVGLKLPCLIDRVLPAETRVTVRMQNYDKNGRKFLLGTAVSPAIPREEVGTYWGYTTRLVGSFNELFSDGPFGSYDYKIGVSDKAGMGIESRKFKIPEFQHVLIVFGSNDGIEDVVENDEHLKMSGKDAYKLFNAYIRTCPTEGCRSPRTEETMMVSLARLTPVLEQAQQSI